VVQWSIVQLKVYFIILSLAMSKDLCSIVAAYFPETLKPGDFVDCLDAASSRYLAEVLDVSSDGTEALIHFVYWDKKWDEWINLDEGRISRVYAPAEFEEESLSSIAVGDRVDWFHPTQHIHECVVVELTEDDHPLLRLQEADTQCGCREYQPPFWVPLTSRVVKRVPTEPDQLIHPRK
jgi:hypothetical protein